MPELPAPGEIRGACNKALPLLPYYIIKAMVMLVLGIHPNQKGNNR